MVAPGVALFALGDARETPFVLTAIGLLLTIGGPLLVSNRLAEPNYDVMLAWDPGGIAGRLGGIETALLLTQLGPRPRHVGRVRAFPGGACRLRRHACQRRDRLRVVGGALRHELRHRGSGTISRQGLTLPPPQVPGADRPTEDLQ
jgi:hypothetical protein